MCVDVHAAAAGAAADVVHGGRFGAVESAAVSPESQLGTTACLHRPCPCPPTRPDARWLTNSCTPFIVHSTLLPPGMIPVMLCSVTTTLEVWHAARMAQLYFVLACIKLDVCSDPVYMCNSLQCFQAGNSSSNSSKPVAYPMCLSKTRMYKQFHVLCVWHIHTDPPAAEHGGRWRPKGWGRGAVGGGGSSAAADARRRPSLGGRWSRTEGEAH